MRSSINKFLHVVVFVSATTKELGWWLSQRLEKPNQGPDHSKPSTLCEDIWISKLHMSTVGTATVLVWSVNEWWAVEGKQESLESDPGCGMKINEDQKPSDLLGAISVLHWREHGGLDEGEKWMACKISWELEWTGCDVWIHLGKEIEKLLNTSLDWWVKGESLSREEDCRKWRNGAGRNGVPFWICGAKHVAFKWRWLLESWIK